MATGNIRCTECNGSGRVLKQNYNQNYANTLGNAGPGMVSCPRCYGRGTVQGYVPDNPNTVGTVSNNNASFSNNNTSFNAWAFIIVWLILFYLTYKIYVPLLDMIFGKDIKVSEYIKWLNVIIIMVPPTVIVYIFRRFIPALFALGIFIGILVFVYGVITN